MKENKTSLVLMVMAVCVFFTACSAEPPMTAGAGGESLQAWFDAPLPGSVFPVGDVAVLAHGAAQDGLAQVELSIAGGGVIGSQPAGQGETLISAAFTWQATTPGEYTLQARAMDVNGDWSAYAFTDVIIGDETPVGAPPSDEQPALTATPTPAACTDLVAFVSETIPDDTVFAPGTAFTKSWTLQNAGTCTWVRGYALSFFDGDQMGGASPIYLSQEVQPGEKITVSVNLTAPTSVGTYKGRWMLMNTEGTLFGLGAQGDVAFWVEIIVRRAGSGGPSVNVIYYPSGRGLPTARQRITFTATASDDVGVQKIEIYLKVVGSDWVLLGTCTNQTSCVVEGGPYSPGSYRLKAVATDTDGNENTSTVVNFEVVA